MQEEKTSPIQSLTFEGSLLCLPSSSNTCACTVFESFWQNLRKAVFLTQLVPHSSMIHPLVFLRLFSSLALL